MSSLFGSQPKPSLFGSTNTTANLQTQQPQSSIFSSFGSSQQQNAGQPSQPAQGGGIFGGAAQAQTSSQPQQQNTSIFGSSTAAQPQSNSLFGRTNTQPQPSLGGSLFSGTSTQNQPPLGGSLQGMGQQQSQNQPRLGMSLLQPGSSIAPRDKTVPEQMQTLLEKWSPESPNCSFEHYFYNRVQPEAVPYYGPQPGEDEKRWEEALSKKPEPGDIPVLCRGFAALGNRLRIQVQSILALQARLHEINNSLTAQLQEHDNRISVRVVDARRRHVALSQRCLNLATKVQVLRNRGYALDSAEEGLKNKLAELERAAFDPKLSSREEEIWARMVSVRERARLLQEETKKAGAGVSQEVIDDDVLRKAKRILNDYDSQITHLKSEIAEIWKDFNEWEGSKNRTV